MTHQEWRTHSWRISSSSGHIASEQQKERLDLQHLPEQVYAQNTLRIHHEPSGWTLTFDAEDALKQWSADDNESIQVAMADKWQAERVEVLKEVKKMNYDWTYTTSYAGRWSNTENPESRSTVRHSDKQLNVELLTDRTIPLVAFQETPLFMSELDDAGTSELTVRVRVTSRYWFVLLRFYLRVDDTIVRLRDVRCYWDETLDSVLSETRWHETRDKSVVRACGPDSDQAARLLMGIAPTGVVRYRMEEMTLEK